MVTSYSKGHEQDATHFSAGVRYFRHQFELAYHHVSLGNSGLLFEDADNFAYTSNPNFPYDQITLSPSIASVAYAISTEWNLIYRYMLFINRHFEISAGGLIGTSLSSHEGHPPTSYKNAHANPYTDQVILTNSISTSQEDFSSFMLGISLLARINITQNLSFAFFAQPIYYTNSLHARIEYTIEKDKFYAQRYTDYTVPYWMVYHGLRIIWTTNIAPKKYTFGTRRMSSR